MSSRAVTVVETSPISHFKYCLVGFPDVGLVGSIALDYTIEEQQMTEVGYLESDAFPPVIVVHHGDPKQPLRLYSKGDIVSLVSEIPIDSRLMPSVARSIVDWAKSKKVELLITISGIAVQNRLEIDVPAVFGIGSSPSVKEVLKGAGIEILDEGFVVGLHAVLMKECLEKNIPSMILLAQSHLQYPDPGAAASLIAHFDKLVGLKVSITKLLTQEGEIRLKMRELMQSTQGQMQSANKRREQEIPPMYS
ncbi:PAC2 family protein [Candidatus Bathyarchaeota archaeon]|nr:PAC2 family protein [Candidatus Bathyarchaeota archaeon]